MVEVRFLQCLEEKKKALKAKDFRATQVDTCAVKYPDLTRSESVFHSLIHTFIHLCIYVFIYSFICFKVFYFILLILRKRERSIDLLLYPENKAVSFSWILA